IPVWIDEHYYINERLGGGEWSDVYLVTDRSAGGTYAVKVLKPDYFADERVRSRFLTEAKAMARLVHPNIVRIYDVGGAMADEPAIVMEYCEGGDLREHTPQRGLPADIVARITLFILLGMVAAHKVGCIHRGLCPESIFLDADLNPKVADFGTALLEQNPHVATRAAEALGEFLYSPPEQRYDARKVDVRSDIYGVGAMMWFMLMGKDPPDLSLATRSPEVVQDIHPYLRQIIVRACHHSPDARYQTASAMGKAVRKLFS
ncbi:MAG: serine/threonine protein kinase, partial [Deltaproteobacteria bacterium]|nr:serine/threonine protein kinase [Deltaproteobacteria bacterium]